MPVCVLVVSDQTAVEELNQQLRETKVPLTQCLAISPEGNTIDRVKMLSPNLTRQLRQKVMARWLMPFGFLAGVTFTQITNLTTFASFGPWGEILISGLLGMGSGLMGSYAAAASVNFDDDNSVRILRNRLEEGRWLVLLETPDSIELPWQVIRRSRPQQVIRLNVL
ncbi:hypothetical protein [Synechococcus sp. M16CYN]|uniref:hypothetical protein n=1 Tax=Synechococcus sp. M16CYN TaxID=3103139 RepID=UPI00325054EB